MGEYQRCWADHSVLKPAHTRVKVRVRVGGWGWG